jgi:type II secretory pathway pseudopilin PulG
MPIVKNLQRGDTIIEVLFAITVFSFVAVAGISLMNQGTGIAQRALETGLVRQQIDSQADALRYLNRAYVIDYGKNGAATVMWNKVVTDFAVDHAERFDSVADRVGCHLPGAVGKPFALNLSQDKLLTDPIIIPTVDTPTYAQVRYDVTGVRAEGIWIQAVKSSTRIGTGDGRVRPGYYDFHIRACWQTPGSDQPVTEGTIVRLYEPRG